MSECDCRKKWVNESRLLIRPAHAPCYPKNERNLELHQYYNKKLILRHLSPTPKQLQNLDVYLGKDGILATNEIQTQILRGNGYKRAVESQPHNHQVG